MRAVLAQTWGLFRESPALPVGLAVLGLVSLVIPLGLLGLFLFPVLPTEVTLLIVAVGLIVLGFGAVFVVPATTAVLLTAVDRAADGAVRIDRGLLPTPHQYVRLFAWLFLAGALSQIVSALVSLGTSALAPLGSQFGGEFSELSSQLPVLAVLWVLFGVLSTVPLVVVAWMPAAIVLDDRSVVAAATQNYEMLRAAPATTTAIVVIESLLAGAQSLAWLLFVIGTVMFTKFDGAGIVDLIETPFIVGSFAVIVCVPVVTVAVLVPLYVSAYRVVSAG